MGMCVIEVVWRCHLTIAVKLPCGRADYDRTVGREVYASYASKGEMSALPEVLSSVHLCQHSG